MCCCLRVSVLVFPLFSCKWLQTSQQQWSRKIVGSRQCAASCMNQLWRHKIAILYDFWRHIWTHILYYSVSMQGVAWWLTSTCHVKTIIQTHTCARTHFLLIYPNYRIFFENWAAKTVWRLFEASKPLIKKFLQYVIWHHWSLIIKAEIVAALQFRFNLQ